MPAQIPPAAWMAGESVLTMIRSSQGVIPSVSTPMTWTVNGLGVVPLLTVKPVPVRPAFTWLTGTAAGQGAGGAAAVWALAGAGSVWAAAGAASAPSASSGATVATATARRPRGRKWRRELESMDTPHLEAGGPQRSHSHGHGGPERTGQGRGPAAALGGGEQTGGAARPARRSPRLRLRTPSLHRGAHGPAAAGRTTRRGLL